MAKDINDALEALISSDEEPKMYSSRKITDEQKEWSLRNCPEELNWASDKDKIDAMKACWKLLQSREAIEAKVAKKESVYTTMDLNVVRGSKTVGPFWFDVYSRIFDLSVLTYQGIFNTDIWLDMKSEVYVRERDILVYSYLITKLYNKSLCKLGPKAKSEVRSKLESLFSKEELILIDTNGCGEMAYLYYRQKVKKVRSNITELDPYVFKYINALAVWVYCKKAGKMFTNENVLEDVDDLASVLWKAEGTDSRGNWSIIQYYSRSMDWLEDFVVYKKLNRSEFQTQLSRLEVSLFYLEGRCDSELHAYESYKWFDEIVMRDMLPL